MPEPFTRQSVSMPPMMLSDLKEEAKRRDLTLSQLVREYIRHGRLCGGKSPGATLADRVREDYEQKREDKEGEL